MVIPDAEHSEAPQAEVNLVGKDYFRIFNYHLLRGRTFTAEDIAAQRKILVVNEAFASKFFPKGDPFGQKIDFPVYDQIQSSGMDQQAAPEAFLPRSVAQQFVTAIAVLTVGNADKFSGAVAQQIWSMNRDVTLGDDRSSIESMLQNVITHSWNLNS